MMSAYSDTEIAGLLELRSQVNPACYSSVEAIVHISKQTVYDAFVTDDGGVILIFENTSLGKELTFIISDDGKQRFFVADLLNRVESRVTGLIRTDDKIETLILWLNDPVNSIVM